MPYGEGTLLVSFVNLLEISPKYSIINLVCREPAAWLLVAWLHSVHPLVLSLPINLQKTALVSLTESYVLKVMYSLRGRALARPRSVGWMWKTALLAWPCNDLPRQRQQHLLHRFIRLDPLSTIDRSFTFRVPIPVKMLWGRCSCQDSKSKKKNKAATLWRASFAVQEPLTWRQFHRMAVKGTISNIFDCSFLLIHFCLR